MKTLSGTVKFVLFPAIAILGVIGLSVCAHAPTPHRWPPKPRNCKEVATLPPTTKPWVKKIKIRRLLKEDNDNGEKKFADLLCSGRYEAAWGNRIHMIHGNANNGAHCLPQDCSDFAQASIKTEKVIVSETAKTAADEELTSITRHVTQQIACETKEDLDAVLDQLQQ